MNFFAFFLGLTFITFAAAYGHGSSYVTRSDHNIPTDHKDEHHDYYHYPSYKYEYGVYDPKTKDHHSQWEHRDGDNVKGEYTLDEADGTVRILNFKKDLNLNFNSFLQIRKVSYTSSKHEGFNAKVERIGHAHHAQEYNHHDEGHYY